MPIWEFAKGMNAALPPGLKKFSMLEISSATRANYIWPGGPRPKRNLGLGKIKI